jgi:hypothetical protein
MRQPNTVNDVAIELGLPHVGQWDLYVTCSGAAV